ncbi:MAG: hypothetical protein ACT4QD_13110 [Acidobacteriota bacterium]
MRTCLVTGALILGGLFATEAAAQPPVLAFSQNGNRVTLNWTPVAGATAYDLIVTGTIAGQFSLPASLTSVSVDAPPGSYNVQVRGTAGSVQGPLSNIIAILIGVVPPPCTPPVAPTATAVVTGGSVTINWTAIAGASSYTVQFSRFPGGTELSVNASATQTSVGQYVGLVGTFYARVVVITPCGNATSAEVAFTVTDLTSGGPRTPDPAPGQLLPVPGYGASVVQSVAGQFPGDLFNSCREHGGNNNFMFRVLSELRKRDSRWGLNDKRGQAGDLSQDIISYNPTNRPDNGESQIYLFDIIFSHCGSNPGWNWADVTAATWAGRGSSACGTEWCARWTIDAYVRAGFTP